MRLLFLTAFLCSSISFSADTPKAKSFSMISLIASPDKYSDSVIETRGWFYLDNRGAEVFAMIFLTKEDLNALNTFNAIKLSFSKNQAYGYSDLHKKFVTVFGKWTSQGPEIGWQLIDPVQSMQEYSKPSYAKKKSHR